MQVLVQLLVYFNIGWEARASSSACSSAPLYSPEGELDGDIHPHCGAPQAADQTKPQDQECGNQGLYVSHVQSSSWYTVHAPGTS